MESSGSKGPSEKLNSEDAVQKPNIPRLPTEEENSLVAESNALKTSANSLFTISDYDGAITGYNRALDSLPTYLEYEIAVLRSNIAACYVKLAEWRSAIDQADQGLDSLVTAEKEVDEAEQSAKDNKVIELADDEEIDEEAVISRPENPRLPKRQDIQRIRTKLLLRRAKAKTETGGWAALQGAQEDYTLLSSFPNLTSLDRKTVQAALKTLPPRLEEAKQKETAEMMGKLKQLGNGLLKPFGLSTDNFKMDKDEKTGGYNLSFNQNN